MTESGDVIHWQICIHWHICKHFNILVPEQSWKHKPSPILENEHKTLTHDKMIPSSVDITNKALLPDIVLKDNGKNGIVD